MPLTMNFLRDCIFDLLSLILIYMKKHTAEANFGGARYYYFVAQLPVASQVR